VEKQRGKEIELTEDKAEKTTQNKQTNQEQR
jgi:hypothetical protein